MSEQTSFKLIALLSEQQGGRFDQLHTTEKGFTTKIVVPEARLKIMQQVAKKHDVTIKVINQPGENYTPSAGVKATLKEGKFYISIFSNKADLTNFWQEVRQLEGESQSAN